MGNGHTGSAGYTGSVVSSNTGSSNIVNSSTVNIVNTVNMGNSDTVNSNTVNTGMNRPAYAAYHLLEKLHALNEDFIGGQMLEYDEVSFDKYFEAREQIFAKLESSVAQDGTELSGNQGVTKKTEQMFKILSEQESLILKQLQSLRLQANQKLDQFQTAQKQRTLYDDHPYQRNPNSNSVFFDRRK